MQKVNLPSHVALTALAFAGAAHAEGIALGNPLTGASFGWLFGLPLLGSAALLLAMALIKGLRKALLVALLLCACFAGILALVGMSGMSSVTGVAWLVGLVLSPWICFVIIGICFFVGIWHESPET